jgi:hypothetical protein
MLSAQLRNMETGRESINHLPAILGRHMQETIYNGPFDSQQTEIITKICTKTYNI